MKPRIILAITLLTIAAFVSFCGKKADNANPLFVGFWYASSPDYNYTLIIKDNSEATYTIESGILNTTTYSGKARITGDNLKIGLKKFHIDQAPKTSSCGLCIMTIDGIELHKQ